MKKINPPSFSLEEVLDVCLGHDERPDSINKFIPKLKPLIETYGDIYEVYANQNKFHMISPVFNVFGVDLTDEDKFYLDNLYKYRFVRREDGRNFYNIIIDEVNYLCPYCNYTDIREVDHFIPKAKYSLCNIHPKNLVPICASCNKDKSEFMGDDYENNLLHPYYDDFDHTQWLFAEIKVVNSICKYEINYNCEPSSSSYNVLEIERLKNYFKKMNLSKRFTRVARSRSQEIETEIGKVLRKKTDGARRLYLQRLMNIKNNEYGKNHWLVALYHAFLSYNGSLDDFR